ncbi:hypothetical protein [Borreliella valaisiana]|uniref:hypothetical protein n=1 Tax=Borreliella valaisiana TaxID=62088 RepID=UPI003B20E7BE
METVIEPTKKGTCKVECQNKERFIKIEKENGKTLYHTKIMMDLYKFGVYENKKNKIITIVSIKGILDKIFYMYVKSILEKLSRNKGDFLWQ